MANNFVFNDYKTFKQFSMFDDSMVITTGLTNEEGKLSGEGLIVSDVDYESIESVELHAIDKGMRGQCVINFIGNFQFQFCFQPHELRTVEELETELNKRIRADK